MIYTKQIFYVGILLACFWSIGAFGEDSSTDDYRGSSIRLGAFGIANVKGKLYFGPEDVPLSIPIELEEDLGFGDKLLVVRASYSYRFSKKHGITVGYYRFDLDGNRQLDREIQIGDSVFDVGLNVRSQYDEKVLKIAYNFIFHDEGRVALSISPGVFVNKAKFNIASELSATGPGGSGVAPVQISEGASLTAPLPVLGGRMQYRISPKWSMILATDVFFLTTSDQEGTLTDSSLIFEWQSDSAFGFGMGLNRYSLNVDAIASGNRWDWESSYFGAYLYATARF